MNVKRKESAVKKYMPIFNQGTTVEELMNLLAQDEKEYTADEINEIKAAVIGDVAENAPPEKKVKKVAVKAAGFEEWRCEIKIERGSDGKETKRVAEKVKRLRECVKITDEEVETLNNGALNSPRQDYVLMYFKPE